MSDIPSRSNVPVPDPSLLTSVALDREIGRLKELVQAQIARIEDRLDDYQESHAKAHAHRIKEVESEVRHLTELMAERFAGIAAQMVERDARVADAAQAGKDAITAALTAQKEMADKAEAAFTKQIDSIQSQIGVLDQARQEQIRSIEKRVDAEEGSRGGLNMAITRSMAAITIIIAAAAVFAAVFVTR
jgi:hypothetical protein